MVEAFSPIKSFFPLALSTVDGVQKPSVSAHPHLPIFSSDDFNPSVAAPAAYSCANTPSDSPQKEAEV